MTVALFVPCYVDQFFPKAATATLELLERLGLTVRVPEGQTCCGQPMANAGVRSAYEPVSARHAALFDGVDYIVSPSGSCTLHMAEFEHATPRRFYELSEFLVDVLGVTRVDAYYPHRVAIHAACHGLRGLRLGPSSERQDQPRDVVRTLLSSVEGLELVTLQRPDECCGFGGTFAVAERAVSVRMGNDRLDDHMEAGAQVVVSTDMSCLMHLQGLSSRQQRGLSFCHIAEILNHRRI